MPTEAEIEAASLAIIDYLDKFHPAPEGFLYTALARDALTAAEEVRGQSVPGWQSIETASKDREIIALSPGYKGPIVLRWFKYDGREAWRDWDGDPHDPTLWFDLPPSEQKASVPDEAAIRADERERCAKIADAMSLTIVRQMDRAGMSAPAAIAEAIRAAAPKPEDKP